MLEELKRHFTSVQILIALLIVAVGVYDLQIVVQFLNMFSDIIIMLLSAWLFGFILEPLVIQVGLLTRSNKLVSAAIVYLLFFGLLGMFIFLFIPEVSSQFIRLQKLLVNVPKYLKQYPPYVNRWIDLFGSSLINVITYLPSIANFLFSLFIMLIISFYFIVDKERINREFFHVVPAQWHKDMKFIQELIDTTFASFLRVQLLFSVILGVVTWIVLRIFGIDFAASTALLAGILAIVPLIGPVLSLIPAVGIALLTDPTRALFVLLMLVILQLIIFNILGPKIIGKAFRLHPVIVILSFIVGYRLAGGAGAIFAVPVLGILVVVLHRLGRHFLRTDNTI